MISVSMIYKEVSDIRNKNYMMTVTEVAEEIGVSKGHAYKLLRELNEELKKAGYVTVAGKIPRAFWEKKFYGYTQMRG